ncbi:Phosphatidylinositol alpha-mannosyltransferase [Acidothermus cellulolyticus 11B]|uniref:Phosphatidylinositol alpha-mannosyltransferase n=1 Tax=Acidothermus cellulolyticus (strain ATCC 43068 / DSM 8971 / 11B) TaxID=351607 RepID=A0LUL5_ACIC1|nr:glycosyltransferase family 4 protein [Acidothermus cellulolyticus]ABK53125.1 Phosphatidylinositol alpha-mannosyltransferase [Acidothermus cellulolyticus 11B]
MRVGLVCPYTWDVPGGVQGHVRDLAETLLEFGHDVSVITPADDDDTLPTYAVPAGRAVPVPYNGSIARLCFGVLSASRVRRWLRDGGFDVVHVHEPAAPSLGLLACWAADGPLVGTFHTSISRSRAMVAAYPILQTALEKIHGRVAVSEAARRTLVEHLGGDAVLIPNGVRVDRFADAEPLDGWPGDGGAIGFVGRIDEPRKGLAVLLDAFHRLARSRPGLRLLIAGPGDGDQLRRSLDTDVRDRVTFLGRVSEDDKARILRSVDVYVAPNTGGESFGVVLLEAMAAGTPVVASDLAAFRAVLDDGHAGRLFPVGDAAALAAVLSDLLSDPAQRVSLALAGRERVRRYDWTVVAREILRVYETVAITPAAVVRRGPLLAAEAGGGLDG